LFHSPIQPSTSEKTIAATTTTEVITVGQRVRKSTPTDTTITSVPARPTDSQIQNKVVGSASDPCGNRSACRDRTYP
jgi:hypothetical protein